MASSLGAAHEREITGGGKASVLNEKSRAVNTLIGNLKTALTGTYHAIKSSPSMLTATSPRCSFASTAATTCQLCSAICFGRWRSHHPLQSAKCALLRFIANQEDGWF